MTTTTHEPRIPAAGGWFKSSWSGPAGECVEINFDRCDGLVRIRDSKERGEGPTISVTGKQWAILLGEFAGTAPAGNNGAVTVAITSSGTRSCKQAATVRLSASPRPSGEHSSLAPVPASSTTLRVHHRSSSLSFGHPGQ